VGGEKLDKKHQSNASDGGLPRAHLLIKLGGKEYLRIKRILEDAKKKLGEERMFLLLLQVPLLSAQEEVCLALQLLRDVV